jgi:F-type H+-transporting ATPase subunit beta
MSTGSVVEIIGAVIDVEFPRDSIPKVYDALKLPWAQQKGCVVEWKLKIRVTQSGFLLARKHWAAS